MAQWDAVVEWWHRRRRVDPAAGRSAKAEHPVKVVDVPGAAAPAVAVAAKMAGAAPAAALARAAAVAAPVAALAQAAAGAAPAVALAEVTAAAPAAALVQAPAGAAPAAAAALAVVAADGPAVAEAFSLFPDHFAAPALPQKFHRAARRQPTQTPRQTKECRREIALLRLASWFLLELLGEVP